MSTSELKKLASSVKAVSGDPKKIAKLCDDARKANPDSSECTELCAQLVTAADEDAVIALCDDVAAKK